MSDTTTPAPEASTAPPADTAPPTDTPAPAATPDTAPDAAPAEPAAASSDEIEAALDELEATEGLPDAGLAEIRKMRKEVKSLRASRNEQAERFAVFDGLHQDDLAALSVFAQHLATGDVDGAVQWVANATKTLAGEDRIADLFGLAAAAAADDGDDGEPPPEKSVEELVQEAVEARLAAEKEREAESAKVAEVRRVAKETAASLGYDTSDDSPAFMALLSMAARRPATGDVQQDITEAHRALKAAFAEGAGTSPEGGDATPPPEGAEPKLPTNATPEQRMKARLDAMFPQG